MEIRRNTDYNYNYSYEYRYYLKLCYSIPEYIKRNLKKMPNNKGYIWKGITLYGCLPPEEETTILFENLGRDILKIHEITEKEYKTFEKKGKDKRILTFKEKRRKIQGAILN
jgi:hypothetical protein